MMVSKLKRLGYEPDILDWTMLVHKSNQTGAIIDKRRNVMLVSFNQHDLIQKEFVAVRRNEWIPTMFSAGMYGGIDIIRVGSWA